MDQILLIAEVAAFAALTALCIALIVTLTTLRRSLREFVQSVLRIETTVRDVSDRLMPTIEFLEEAASNVRSIIREVSDQIATLRSAVRLVNVGVDSVARFRDRVEEWVMRPFENGASILAGMVRGARTFASKMRTEDDEPGRSLRK